MRIPRKKKKKIPKGVYCYTPKGIVWKENTFIYKVKLCPFYKHMDGLEGHCSLFKYEVIDQCKIC